jgi:XdhC/CoxI family protein
MGLAEDRLARLKVPAGLDIHGIEPAEIALSITAEIVERRRRGLRRDALGDLRRADQGIRVVIPSQPALRQSRCGCGDRRRSSSGTCNISAARPLPITVPSERDRLDKWLPLAGDRGFESCSLLRRVCCEPDFRGCIPSMTVSGHLTGDVLPGTRSAFTAIRTRTRSR